MKTSILPITRNSEYRGNDMTIQIETERDVEGYLMDPESWNEDIARELATEEGLGLTEEYWPILNFMRDYWREHRVAPDVRHVVGFLVDDQGMGRKEAKEHLFNLFPYGYVKQACKVSGMMRPRAWSTG
jgi:TusE/DsrC/DsvC family sulfur relay protein